MKLFKKTTMSVFTVLIALTFVSTAFAGSDVPNWGAFGGADVNWATNDIGANFSKDWTRDQIKAFVNREWTQEEKD